MGKKWGQHFIAPSLAKYIASFGYGKVLEIGAGDGRITKHINADEVWAVEIDKRFCEKLLKLDVHVICKDFLKVKPFEVDVILGSIPYYISSRIVFKLREWIFKEAYLVLQYEFAKKMCAKPGQSNYGRLSVTSQLFYDVKFIRKISKHLFTPMPDVDSALIKITKKENNVSDELLELIRLLFSHKNKKIKNILDKCPEELCNKRPRHMSIDEIKRLLSFVGPLDQR